jgi:ubiquinone/menaquinone biosynthesis C-methylase UbiE
VGEPLYSGTVNENSSNPDPTLLKKYRIRIMIFLIAVAVVVPLLNVAYRGINTLYVLNEVESERDRWQRPSDVISALKLNNGGVVADVGSGAGYFSLKLSRVVSRSGTVYAVDISKLPLAFLWTRSFLAGQHNIHIVVAASDDPQLPAGTVDAVLIAHTYHEFADPNSILDQIYSSLRSGGRLVVLDRGPSDDQSSQGADHHEISPATVEAQLRQKSFEILARDDSFVRHQGEQWWLLVARR